MSKRVIKVETHACYNTGSKDKTFMLLLLFTESDLRASILACEDLTRIIPRLFRAILIELSDRTSLGRIKDFMPAARSLILIMDWTTETT